MTFQIMLGWYLKKTIGIRICGMRQDIPEIEQSFNRIAPQIPDLARDFFSRSIDSWKAGVGEEFSQGI